LCNRREDYFQKERIASRQMVAFLDRIESGQKFEEGSVMVTIAGEPHKCCNRESERLQVDLRPITSDEFKAFKLTYAFGGCRGRETDSPAQLGEWDACVGGEFLEYLLVDEIDSARLKHLLTSDSLS
jgi:hypothetical protein